MPLIADPDLLSQGAATNSAGVSVGSITSRQATFTATATLPALNAGQYFVVRNSPDTQNNGVWLETGGTPTTSAVTAEKVTGSDPIAGGPDTLDFLGTSSDEPNIAFDVATREWLLLEDNGLDADGATMQAIYSAMMIFWKDDAFLIANAPFPMFMIDADAGKNIIGQDASGNFAGWTPFDDATYSVRTRKLIRNAGWSEVDSNGVTQRIYPGIGTIGTFEDPVNDFAYFQLGNDTEVDDTINFTFAGPVNEPVLAYERLADGSINGGSGVAISADGRTMTRSDGGNWRTDGFVVGGRIILRDSENGTNDGGLSATGFGAGAFLLSVVEDSADGDVEMGTSADTGTGFDFVDGGGGNDQIVRNDGGSWSTEGYFVGGNVTVANATTGANDGTYTILAISSDGTTIDVATASLTADTGDNTATFGPLDPTGTPDTAVNAAIDNLNSINLRLRVRDGDTNGKTFSQSNLAAVDETILSNRRFRFGLANATDLKISATDSDITTNSPYTGMSITFHSTPQSLGGAGADELVGGPYNFGIVVDANDGTDQQVYEFVQWSLRQLTDIDADADTAIGRTIDGLMRFLGDSLQVGSTDGGLTFPRNPQGGGAGVMITDLNAASRNTTTVFDNTGTSRGFPIGTVVTLDFNQTLIDDTVAEYTLYFDWTIRTVVTDLVITAGTGPVGTIDSAGSNLPSSLDAGVGAYIRISTLTGADEPMNGIYQVTSISTSQYDVVRYDGADIVTTSSASVPLDEHPIDSPDAIIVEDNTTTDVQGLASSDFVFTFDYSNNAQGGRTPATDADVVARAIGQESAQYTQSSVQTIGSGVPLTVPVSSQIERNYFNPA